jgi:hypothetical protein
MPEIESRVVEEVGSIPRRMSQYKGGSERTWNIRQFSASAGLDNGNPQ